MIEIIMDEKAWCEDALRNYSLGTNPAGTLSRIAKYYYTLGHKRSEIARLLEGHLLRCNPDVNVYRWQDIIASCVRHADRRPLIKVDFVPITQAELDKISGLSSLISRKVMFTLICLAKYRNAINPNNDNWVSYENKDIFRLAGITMNRARQYALLNDLWQEGYIAMSKIVDNTSFRVTIVENSSPVVMEITDFRNLGNQLMRLSDPKYLECANCGLVVKRLSPSQKYCNACASDIKTSQNTAYRSKHSCA